MNKKLAFNKSLSKSFKSNLLKYITIIFFFGFIFIVPIVTLSTPDKKINEIENKILTQFPEFNLSSIKSKRFMKNFDNYTSDQFPFRTDFIKLKNIYNYTIGNREFRDIYMSKDGRLMEKFIFNKDIIDKNISQATMLSNYLYDNYNINSKLIVIPTSIAFYEDLLPSWSYNDSQETSLNYIEGNINSSKLSFYNPYSILSKNKDKYIYFNTDHHWTQLGAKIVYDDLYNYNLDGYIYSNYDKVSDNFYGTYYSKAILPNIKGDAIFAYKNYNNFKMSIDFSKTFNTLYNEDKLNGKNKYQYFLHGDPGFAVIEGNPSKHNEILIFKDSYAHSFIPFLTNDYNKIHVVDPRYYTLDIDDYLNNNKNIKEVLFINNLQTFNSDELYKKVK
ncbi:DHHW family protein [[Clostridium] dakarense]|uniref:DHHW family protein n=1 Tax=Faecalimicrobium dakarense TaxID=1301100 RepID=UPI0004B50593|nr:DHHW family protein [[Clostridium] dakarense]